MKSVKTISLSAILIFGLSGSALQADESSATAESEEVQAVLDARSDFMKGMGATMKAFTNYLKRGDGEPIELAARAAEIAENAPSIPDLFPENTGLPHIEKSESKPVIWENWDGFVAAANALVEPAMAVEAAFESEDKSAIGAAVKKLGGEGCRACHNEYREPHDH